MSDAQIVSAPHEQLSAYLDGELDPESAAALEVKLARSERLRAELDRMRRADGEVMRWLDGADAPSLAAVLLPPRARRRWPWVIGPLAVSLAAAAALFIFLRPAAPAVPDPVDYAAMVAAMVEDHGAFVRGDATPEHEAATLASAERWLDRERGLAVLMPYRDRVIASATRCTLLETPVAAVFVSREDTLVSTFAVSEEGVSRAGAEAVFPGRCAARGDQSTCEWAADGWRYVAVSRRAPEGLRGTLANLAR